MSNFRNIELPPNLGKYFPRIYDDIKESDALIGSENKMFEMMAKHLNIVTDNQYVLTATEWGIKKYEDMLGIIVDPETEDLEFRRQRILNRLTMNPPYTSVFLRQKLDEILGVGNYRLLISNGTNLETGDVVPEYTFIVESAAENLQWYEELAITIGKIKPANLVYITRPLLRRDVNTNEEIKYSEMTWNYGLNGSWKLGDEKPFVSMSDKGVIKVSGVKSVKHEMLDVMAKSVSSAITKIVINGVYTITDFTVTPKTVGDDHSTVVLTYAIPADSGLGYITDVATYKGDEIMTRSSVYVPLIQDVEMKHTTMIKEG